MSDHNLQSLFTHQVPQARLDPDELRANAGTADPALLLLSLAHVTGDASVLDRYAGRISAPQGTVKRAIIPTATVSDEVRAELVDQLCAALSRDDQPEYLGVDDLALFGRMADIAVGRQVAEEYLPMFREQAGFVPDQRAVEPTRTPPATLNVAILGAGMTGIAAGVSAVDRGFSFEIFEQSPSLGGVWRANTYPGVAVDTLSAYYSLSFATNPDWSHLFPIGEQYLAYLQEVSDRHGITEHIRFNTEVSRIEWDDQAQVWELTTIAADRTVRKVRAAAVITAAGHLNRPKYPALDGRDSFAGASFHSAEWDHSVDLRGKRVGIIGAGATAVQVVAAIAGEVGHLTLFQRQPHWVVPNLAGDNVIPESERWLLRHLPYYQQWFRFKAFWFTGDENGYATVRVDQEWMKDHLSISPGNDRLMQVCLQYIDSCFGAGSELARKVTPDYAPAGKRLVRDPADFIPGGYYYALSQPHVDVDTSKLDRVVPEGILTVDGDLIELDVIVYATGFTLDWLSPVEVIGRDGVRLADVWRNNNPQSYLGGTVPGFPNLFVNSGPNTGVGHAGGHNFMAEVVNHYAFECLQLVVERGARSIEVTQQAHDEHNARLDAVMDGSIWTHVLGAHTYYRNEAERVILPSPWRLVEYWEMSQTPIEEKFTLR
ncbi:flavin-containing monooxygenase [Frankia gtarii]|uniref:flavin-containing monooxygenase n=1 Tax=Frankia gtarii TaxID=2950102 RepID=UPI0021BEA843|nr:NAD(P)/FAD-dependent oxidoreductase [Frankia gtarii]